MSTRVLIADNNPIIRRTLRHVLGGLSGCAICGEAQNGEDAIERAMELQPDVIVLDLSMPLMTGLQASRILRNLMPQVQIILFTVFAHNNYIEREARTAGVTSVVSKLDGTSGLVDCIGKIAGAGVKLEMRPDEPCHAVPSLV